MAMKSRGGVMRRKVTFALLGLILISILFMGSRTVEYEMARIPHWSFKTVLYDTTLTNISDTLATETFTISGYPYSSIQVRITSANDTLTLKYRCSQFDSTAYWNVAEMESVAVIGGTTMQIYGNADLGIPVTRYTRYYFIATTTTIDFKVFFNFWRGE